MIQDGKSNNLHWVEARGGALPHAAIKVTQQCLQKIILYLSKYFILQKINISSFIFQNIIFNFSNNNFFYLLKFNLLSFKIHSFIFQKIIFYIFQKTGHERNGDPLFVARAKVAGGHWAVGGFLQFLVFTFG